MSTISEEIREREMRTTGDLEGLPAGMVQKASGDCWCAQQAAEPGLLQPFSAGALC